MNVPEEPRSYSEKYRGSPYAQQAAPADPAPVRQRTRPRPLGVFIILVGLGWVFNGFVGIIGTFALGATGFLAGPMTPTVRALIQPMIAIGLVVDVVYVLIGLKIILAPGSRTLGCTGLLSLLSAAAIFLASSGIADRPPLVAIVLGLMVAFSFVLGFGALLASQLVG